MISSTILISVIGLCLVTIIILYLSLRSSVQTKTDALSRAEDQLAFVMNELAQERQLLANANGRIENLNKDNSMLEANLLNLRERYDEMQEDEKGRSEKFELLARKILEEKSQRFDAQHKAGIKEILDPLKERIQKFEEKVENTHRDTISRHSSLIAQINHLRDLNHQITQETTNLTKALKGDNKTQGNWGEIILESILEKSGLEKDREYFVQPSYTSDQGRALRPDVVIHLPEGKKMIIDSKVSLKAYDQLVSSENKEEQQIALKALSLSIKTHVDGLSSKNYHDIYQIESPDFVLMFIPIDSAFTAALGQNPDLYTYAFDKNIVIVTSSTLLATLKTVDSMWRNDKQQRYALEIADEAGKMYDKLANLVEDLVKVGERIDMTKNIYEDSMRKLTSGKGNLIARAEKMKSLGAKANKAIRENVSRRALE